MDANGLGLLNTSVLGGGTELGSNLVRPGRSRRHVPGQRRFSDIHVPADPEQRRGSGDCDRDRRRRRRRRSHPGRGSQLAEQPAEQLWHHGLGGRQRSAEFRWQRAFHGRNLDRDGADPIATTGTSATNNGVYSLHSAAYTAGAAETLTFQNGQGTANVVLGTAETVGTVIAKVNAATASLGIYAVADPLGTGISFQSVSNFTSSTTLAGERFRGLRRSGSGHGAHHLRFGYRQCASRHQLH